MSYDFATIINHTDADYNGVTGTIIGAPTLFIGMEQVPCFTLHIPEDHPSIQTTTGRKAFIIDVPQRDTNPGWY